MTPKIVLFLAIIPISLHAEMFDDWDNMDKGLYVGSCIASAADMYTTDRIIKKGGHENNCILPDHPKTSRLVAHWFICAVGKIIIADLLPSEIRKAFLFGCMSIDIGYANRNTIRIRHEF